MNINKLKYKLKDVIEQLPYCLGHFISFVPNVLFFGQKFKEYKKDINFIVTLDENGKKDFVYNRIKNIVDYAYFNTEFYKNFYESKGFSPDSLERFSDIKKIPIVRKEDFQEFSLKRRSNLSEGGVKINTGGTTGEPLEFYIEDTAFSREWAHMLHIWSELDYSRTDLKLTFRGKNIGDSILQYNPVNNEYLVNTFVAMEQVSHAVASLIKNRDIKYLHGYPSAIYEFAKFVGGNSTEISAGLNSTLKGILYGSEFPAPVYRNLINKVFEVPDISWYGHSEMCILAYERTKKWVYEPMFSYGYCETVPANSGDYKLVGTSYHNRISPFIRYDTGDLVNPNIENGILKSFEISRGRVGEFIKDSNGQSISLTSLIFGRHHEIFGKAKFIQIGQKKSGKATIYIVPIENAELSKEEIRSNFDSTNVNVDFSYQIIKKPVKSNSGKVPLLVTK